MNNVELKYQPRMSSAYYVTNYTQIPTKEHDGPKMHGSWRVITFCLLTTVLPTILIVIPLYLRNIKYADVMYKISDSDVIQIHKGQSSIFCEKHSLTMNASFNAFQMKGRPELSGERKRIKLKKYMSLPDDTLEYWGFYLFKGATVEVKACSRYEGSKIMVVKGERILNTCGILSGEKYKNNKLKVKNQGPVIVTLEDPATKLKNNNIPNKPNPKQKKETKGGPTLVDNGEIFEESWEVHEKLGNDTDDSINNFEAYILKSNGTAKSNRKRREMRKQPLHNPNTVLDAGVNHGGNAKNLTAAQDSVSSFENSLHECYNENVLMNKYFQHSKDCNSADYLDKTTTIKFDVLVDGYYYYIFYSDNDFVINDIYVIFDIFKPTFQYVNMSDSKVCINKTKCEFDVGFFSDELVIVEVPTKDGLQNDDDDTSILISTCNPRTSVYIFFPVAVLLFILLFAFL